jgi:hypothetical protein
MTRLERRQSPRTTIGKHAYVNIEPNNGGIVLNVSDGGLCFHSFDPVPGNGTIRFWFAEHDQRIEAEGTLAWMDQTHKGGLRFTALPAEAREKIRNWMSQAAAQIAATEVPAPESPTPRVRPTPATVRPEAKPAQADYTPVAVVSSEVKVPVRLSGFSRGLATGLLVSGFVVAVFVFQSYRREIGESLIQLGERFAAKPHAETMVVSAAPPAVVTTPVAAPTAPALSPAPQGMAPERQTTSPAPQTGLPAPASIQVRQPEIAQPEARQTEARQTEVRQVEVRQPETRHPEKVPPPVE